MGTIDFGGTIHIEQCQTSKKKIANAIAHCEWTLKMQQIENYDGNVTWIQVKYLESTLETKESTIGQIQVSHDEMLSKIANAAEGQTLSWQQQKAEMEEHYAQLLAEIHARHKVLTSLIPYICTF